MIKGVLSLMGHFRSTSLRDTALPETRSSLSLAFLRDAPWLTRHRIRNYAALLIAASAAMVFWLLTGSGINDPLGRPIGTDFVSFWTVSWALLHEHTQDVYAAEALAEMERAVENGGHSFYAFLYSPIALLIVYPLALLPYLWSLTAWLSASLLGYLAALWRILPQPLTLWASLAFPAVLVTIEHGQNAFLTTSLLAGALLLLTRRPIAAGIMIGLLSFKPQLGLLLPVAFIAGGHWRVVGAAAATAIGLVAATVILFGAQIWFEYFASMPLARDVLELGLVPAYKMQSAFAAVRLLGGPSSAAYGVQALVALGAAIVVVWVWRQPVEQDLKNVALIAATPLATPFVLDYDLVLLAPAIAWLVKAGLRNGSLPWERMTLVAACLDPLISRVAGQYTHIPLTPAVGGALLLLAIRRIRVEKSPGGQDSAMSKQLIDSQAALGPAVRPMG